jgi:hypothetical protein
MAPWPIFEKSSHLREKGGVLIKLMLFKTTRHLELFLRRQGTVQLPQLSRLVKRQLMREH